MTTMTIVETTCDRCHAVERRSQTVAALPDGWKTVHISRAPLDHSPLEPKELCPSCAAVVEEALRPRERVRKAQAEKP